MINSKKNLPIDEVTESTHHTFFYFIRLIDALALNTKEKKYFININMLPSEIQYDLIADGDFLLNSSNIYLSEDEKRAVFTILEAVKKIPLSIIACHEINHLDCPVWESLRLAAITLKLALKDSIEKNNQFFISAL